MKDIEDTWPCVKEILNSVLKARQTEAAIMPDVDPVMDFPRRSAAGVAGGWYSLAVFVRQRDDGLNVAVGPC